ncbi:MAG: glycoside hydrolase family 3 protein [Eubacteriales bacterium]|nr:glycoside hydrolase family 3 protein [Eubacteriales bacterium]
MKHSRVWTGLSSLFTFLLVLALVGMDCMMGYAGTVNQALGIQTSKIVNEGSAGEDTTYYESGYGELNADNLQKLIEDTYAEAVQEEAEGAVLLKNENQALPLSEEETRVTLFGHAVAQPLYKNASAGSKGYQSEYNIDLYQALSDVGFEMNDTLYDAYVASETARGTGAYDFVSGTSSVKSLGEENISFYTDELKSSWEKDYNDVAIVMFAREAGEGMELEVTDSYEGISQLALHQEEKDLLQMIKDSGKFKKTIVLINSGNPMEMEWLDEYGVDACLWIGQPGQRGFEAVAGILTGAINPSGHLTDTYAANSLSAPSVVNGSFNNQNWSNLDEVLEAIEDEDSGISWSTVQAEGIYIGYKYYETRYEDVILKQGNADDGAGSSDGKAWNYAAEVTYPFGYGLSYTEFEQTLDHVTVEDDRITVTVTVKNTGDIAGKSVVQVYAQTPYGDYEKENLVEKSAIQLLDFGKTEMLQPGESQTLTIEGDKYLLASYDYMKANGYIMSEGDYYIAIGENAHDALNNILAAKGAEGMVDADGTEVAGAENKTYTWNEKFDQDTYRTSRYTGEEVTNQFADADINYWQEGTVTYLSRNDWAGTYPTVATRIELSEEMITALAGDYYTKPDDAPSVSEFIQGENQGIPLAAMIGLDYDDEQWETYLNQFTIEELAVSIADNFGTAEITSVGKPAILVGDGPDGVGGSFNAESYGDGRQDCCFPTEIVLASTFNKELMRKRGELMAEECLYLGMMEDWMPGAKHCIGNDQENNREGIAVFFNEQAFREGALRGVEGALAVAGGQAVMHGFNRLGFVWCSSSTALCTQILENEWGFVGQQETDAVAGAVGTYKGHFVSAVAAGTDNFCLDFSGDSSRALVQAITENDDGYLLIALRKSAHDYLYMAANSNIMNGYSVNSKVVSVIPWWQPLMYGLIAVFAVLDILCLIMLFRKRFSKKSNINVEVQE